MTRLALIFLLALSIASVALSIVVAQKDFSIYPLVQTLEFGTQLEPRLSEDGYGLEFPAPGFEPSPNFSMQYSYPDDAVIYSMRFVEPDPNTDYSAYTPEQPTLDLKVIPNPQP